MLLRCRACCAPLHCFVLFNLQYRSFSERVQSIKIDIEHRSASTQQQSQSLQRSNSTLPIEQQAGYFSQALQSWHEQCQTLDFQSLFTAINSYCISLPSVIYHLPDIVPELCSTLLKNDPFTAPAVLEYCIALHCVSLMHSCSCTVFCFCLVCISLIAALARDVRADLYPFCTQIFTAIVSILNRLLQSLYHHSATGAKQSLATATTGSSVISKSTSSSSSAATVAHFIDSLFSCLAFIFKYLQKQLVDDIENLYR